MLSSQPEPGSPYLKSLPPWEELDYHRRPRGLRNWRYWVTLTCCVGATAFASWSVRPAHHWVHQATPVSVAHAMFNQDCARCHVEALRPIQRLVSGDTVRSVSDTTCNSCHHGPIHKLQQVRDPGCATCHREHRGKPILAHVADAHCADCHQNLQRKDGAPARFANISAFSTDHPEFRAVLPGSVDPARLRFNHKFHLELDLKTLRDHGSPGLERFGDRLDCITCHQPDAERRYMLPLQYERHCASCHPLGVQLVGDFQVEGAQAAAEAFRQKPAPHREPSVVRAVLRERLVEFARQHPVVPGATPAAERDRVIPGRESRPLTEREWLWVKGRLQEAEELLFIQKQLSRMEKPLFQSSANCAHCHSRKATSPGRDGLPDYEPTNIPARWFPHSIFRHDSHRMLQCTACHAQAQTSTQTSDILLPKREACLPCHHPGRGARTDCVHCHTYHDRTRERSVNGSHTLEGFLPRE